MSSWCYYEYIVCLKTSIRSVEAEIRALGSIFGLAVPCRFHVVSREANFSKVYFNLHDYSSEMFIHHLVLNQSDGNYTVVLAKVVVTEDPRRLFKLNINVD